MARTRMIQKRLNIRVLSNDRDSPSVLVQVPYTDSMSVAALFAQVASVLGVPEVQLKVGERELPPNGTMGELNLESETSHFFAIPMPQRDCGQDPYFQFSVRFLQAVSPVSYNLFGMVPGETVGSLKLHISQLCPNVTPRPGDILLWNQGVLLDTDEATLESAGILPFSTIDVADSATLMKVLQGLNAPKAPTRNPAEIVKQTKRTRNPTAKMQSKQVQPTSVARRTKQ